MRKLHTSNGARACLNTIWAAARLLEYWASFVSARWNCELQNAPWRGWPTARAGDACLLGLLLPTDPTARVALYLLTSTRMMVGAEGIESVAESANGSRCIDSSCKGRTCNWCSGTRSTDKRVNWAMSHIPHTGWSVHRIFSASARSWGARPRRRGAQHGVAEQQLGCGLPNISTRQPSR